MVKHRVMVTLAGLVAAALLASCGGTGGGSASGSASAAEPESWSYTDGSGKTVELDAVPTRIVAHAQSAAALISMGIRPVGVYADQPVAGDPELGELDLEGIEIVGETWGEIDVEKVLSLQPDLIVAEWWPLDDSYSGLSEEASDESKGIVDIAPVVGPAQGTSIVTLLEDYEDLAASLGADVESSTAADDKAAFEAAVEEFRAAAEAKPGLSVLAVSPTEDTLYVAAPEGSAELSDFASWGMNVLAPEVADDRGYWETLSWENADKYQPDLIMVDDRFGTTALETAKAQPTWTTMKAAEAGAVVDWPAFWIRTYVSYAEELGKLTEAVGAADENLVP